MSHCEAGLPGSINGIGAASQMQLFKNPLFHWYKWRARGDSNARPCASEFWEHKF
jgi:hypothetical protein